MPRLIYCILYEPMMSWIHETYLYIFQYNYMYSVHLFVIKGDTISYLHTSIGLYVDEHCFSYHIFYAKHQLT